MVKTDKALLEKIIFIVLLAVFVLNLTGVKKGTRKNVAFITRKMENQVLVDIKDIKRKLLKASQRDFEVESIYRDPLSRPSDFVPKKEGSIATRPEDAPRSEEELSLEGILWGGRENMAIISGYVVKEKEKIGTAKMLSITEDTVVLERNGIIIELKR